MKAILDETGTLTVVAENALEAYALDRWADDYFGEQKSTTRRASFIVSPTVDRPARNLVPMPSPGTIA
jgi:hypothetical protein